jgi:hypothetical protein
MGSLVQQFGDDQILKSGDRVKPSEAAAMILVLEQRTDIPIPDFIKSEYDEGPQKGYLWMSVVPGRTLDCMWQEVDADTKRRLCRDTWAIVAKIRLIRRPPECEGLFQCSADGSPTEDPLLKGLQQPPTPILNDDALRGRIHERYLYYVGRKYAKPLPGMLPRSSRSVFTHADIAPRNIMVDEHRQITGIIDWEAAGWYPHYWEYANIMRPACRCGDWQEWMDLTAPKAFKCNLQGINAARRVLF